MKNVQTITTKEDLKISSLKRGEIHRLHLHLSDNSLGVPWRLPVMVIRGIKKGPTIGITAAVHGNELNGIFTIFKLIEAIDPKHLTGNLILVPISNLPGYLNNKRQFSDNVDLNRIMPGRAEGLGSSVYAYYFTSKVIKKFDYLLDLHTASHGRINSLYIRADLDNEICRKLAYLQNPHIIVKKYDEEKTLRGWANEQGIPSITIEIGNPSTFQEKLVDETLDGVLNTMKYLKMIPGKVKDYLGNTTICDHSFWIYSKKGGIVEVYPELTQKVTAGEVIARVYDVFGRIREEIVASRSGIVIGKNIQPNCDTGSRILHLGVDIIDPLPNHLPANKSK